MDGLVFDRIVYYLTEPESVFWTDHDTAEVAHTLGLVSKTGWISDLSRFIWENLRKRHSNTPELPERELFWYYTLSRMENLMNSYRIRFKKYSRTQILNVLEKWCIHFYIPLRMRPKIVGQTRISKTQAIREYKLDNDDLKQFEPEIATNSYNHSRYIYLYPTREIRKYARYKQYCIQVSKNVNHRRIEFSREGMTISGKITAFYPSNLLYHILISRKKLMEQLDNLQYYIWVSTTFQVDGKIFNGRYRLKSITTERVKLDMRLDLKLN